jgi:hypothetical protein
MANQICVIKPYKWNGMWVFDDERVGLLKEPFVAGADTLIDVAVAAYGVPRAEEGFLLVFSGDPFPTAQFQLEWRRAETGGNVYGWNGREGWLCPALLKYFEKPPATIHVEVRGLPEGGWVKKP